MKYLLTIPVLFANFAFAEIYEDYEPSRQVTELTVISVQPNYMDDYLVNLKKTWVRSSEIQKELGHIVDYAVWTSEVANSPNLWITVTYENMGAMQQTKEKYDAVNKLMAMSLFTASYFSLVCCIAPIFSYVTVIHKLGLFATSEVHTA